MGGRLRGRRVAVISCGLAGGLDPALATGTVVIPDQVLRRGGAWACDPDLAAELGAAASRLRLPVVKGMLATAGGLVTGDQRAEWRRGGAVAVDMETAALFEVSNRVAAVRVILDTPAREMSGRWVRPARAAVSPTLWPELGWLALHAPPAAIRAAAVVAEALSARVA